MRRSVPLALVLLAGCGGRDAPPPAAPPPAPPAAAYVGREACRRCHVEVFATYARTGMGRSWYAMRADRVVEDFGKKNEIEIPGSGLRYRMTARNGRFFMRQFLVDSRGREVAADERPMIQVAGSGNHSRSYVTVENGRMFQMPVCWYPGPGLWDLCPGYEQKNDYFGREISPSCVFCHNARMEPVAGRRNLFHDPVPEGIDCERCHGPGSEHVAKWAGGSEAPTGGADATIVNPARRPPAARLQVCMQCHFGDSLASERVARPGHVLHEFRPGGSLGEVMVPFRYVQATSRDFGISAQADRFLLSRCFKESGGKFDCTACHDPHRPANDEGLADLRTRKACLQCHAATACTAPASERARTAPPDACVTCHMRRAEPDDHPHATFTDHWIRRRPDAPAPNARTDVAVEPVFPELLDALPPAERAYAVGRAYYLKAMDAPPQVRPPMWSEAAQRIAEAERLGLAGADAAFFLGKSLSYLGRRDEAAQAFRRAAERDPAHYDAGFAWGQALLREGRAEEAASVFEGLIARFDDDAGALSELARCRLAAGQAAEALERWNEAIAIEPATASLHANRAAVLAATGRLDEAMTAIENAVRRSPEDAALWRAYAEIATRAGRPDAAREATAFAERFARRPAPEHVRRGMMGIGS